MKAELFWQVFLKTGSPEAYLMYNEAKRMEHTHVSQYERPGNSGYSLQ